MTNTNWEILKSIFFIVIILFIASIYNMRKESTLCEEFSKNNKVETTYTVMQGCLIKCGENKYTTIKHFNYLGKDKYNESKNRLCKQ